MMVLHLLLHVLIYQLLTARGGKKECPKNAEKVDSKVVKPRAVTSDNDKRSNFIIKHVTECPKEGYYFTREPSPNSLDPGPCYLCYCQEDNKVICWKRESSACANETILHPDVVEGNSSAEGNDENDIRYRRSPGISTALHRGQSKSAPKANKLDGSKCKPYESTISDDCPPEDWCRGCTICECGTSGRWQCNVLKYCRDKNKGPENSKRAKKVVKMKSKSTAAPKNTAAHLKTSKVQIKRSNQSNDTSKKHEVKKSIATGKSQNGRFQKRKQSKRYHVISNIGPNNNASVMIIKKNIATHSPIELKGNKIMKIYKNDRNTTQQNRATQMIGVFKKKADNGYSNITEIVDYRQMRFPRIENHTDIVNSNKNVVDILSPLDNRIIKRQLKVPSIRYYDPTSWRRRYRRAVAPLTSNAASLVAQEENLKRSKSIPESNNLEHTTKPMSSNLLAESFTVMPNTRLIHAKHNRENYYKYDVATEKTSGLTPLDKNINIHVNLLDLATLDNKALKQKNTTNSNNKLIKKDAASNETKNNSKYLHRSLATQTDIDTKSDIYSPIHSFKYFIRVQPDAKDIKNPKWPLLNIFKKNNVKLPVERSMNILKLVANKSVNSDNNKIRGKDIGRVNVAKKYNLVKILNRPRHVYSPAIIDDSASVNKSDLNDILRKILIGNNTSMLMRSKKTRRLNVIKYWKKILNKMFQRNDLPERLNRNHVIHTLCENFGPCYINENDKDLLQSRIAQLGQETETIIKIVKINKGLLRLLGNQEAINENSTQEYFSNDIQRLHSILKGTYESYFKGHLTEFQVLQIKYIKKNVQYFVKSIGKFTILLDDLITLLTRKNNNNDVFKSKKSSETVPKLDNFQNLKVLLSKYNLVQNNFMRKVLDFLNKFEARNRVPYKVRNIVKVDKSTQNSNSTLVIENFAKSIIHNIRKLKQLAQTLNATRSKGRLKRETDSEDAMEYLLTFMEYLLKGNSVQSENAAANDGLDLLIDAIKNSPDIKSVTKKVLPYGPLAVFNKNYKTISKVNRRNKEVSGSDDNSSSADKVSSEDTNKRNTKTEDEILQLVKEKNKGLTSIDTSTTATSSAVHNVFHVSMRPQYLYRNLPVTQFPVLEENVLKNTVKFFDVTTPLQTDLETDIQFSFKEKSNEINKSDILTESMGSNNNDLNEHTESSKNRMKSISNFEDSNIYDYTNTERSRSNARKINFNYAESDGDDDIYDLNVGNVKFNRNNISSVNDYTTNSFDDNIDKNINEITVMPNDAEKVNFFDDVVASGNNSNYDLLNTGENLNIIANETNQEQNTTQPEDAEEDISGQNVLGTTTQSASTKSPKKIKSLPFKSLDADSEFIDQKSKLEWIVENFGTEEKSIDEDKREDLGIKNTSKPNTEASINVSNESIAKPAEQGVKQDAVLLAKHKNLMNYLDYGPTEKEETEDEDSKSGNGGNVDDKYTDSFSAYFV